MYDLGRLVAALAAANFQPVDDWTAQHWVMRLREVGSFFPLRSCGEVDSRTVFVHFEAYEISVCDLENLCTGRVTYLDSSHLSLPKRGSGSVPVLGIESGFGSQSLASGGGAGKLLQSSA